MVQTYNPPLMDVNAETPPELQPVFSLLNSHSNKLYQEGYFLKLDDQNTRMRRFSFLLPTYLSCRRIFGPRDARTHTCSFSASEDAQQADTTFQLASLIPTAHGPSALPSSSVLSCRYGMPPSWMRPARKARSSPSSSTSRMLRSR
jgi:hypothetical protein